MCVWGCCVHVGVWVLACVGMDHMHDVRLADRFSVGSCDVVMYCCDLRSSMSVT